MLELGVETPAESRGVMTRRIIAAIILSIIAFHYAWATDEEMNFKFAPQMHGDSQLHGEGQLQGESVPAPEYRP